MMRRLRASRATRKFVRNKMAMVSLGVIALYALVAGFVVVGGVTLDDTRLRVGPDKMPGWLERISDERRVSEALNRFDVIKRTYERATSTGEDPMRTLHELDWAERRIASPDVERFSELMSVAEEHYYTLDDVLSYRDELQLELHELQEEGGGDAQEMGELEQEIATSSSQAEAALNGLEQTMLEMQPIPGGWSGTLYRLRLSFGTDDKGASILFKALYSTKIAFQIGMVTSVVAVIIGSLLGAAAAYFGGWVDNAVMWVVSTLSSIPYLVLLAVLVFMFQGSIFDNTQEPALALVPVYAAFCLTFWIGTCRVVRGEVMKIKELEYVQAATALGFGRGYILLRHVLPNTVHLMFINFSLLFIGAIKSEVILSFLGLGVKGQPSWGVMIAHGQSHVTSFFFWEVLTATVFMFGLVLAFNIVSDALQDAFDPKHVG